MGRIKKHAHFVYPVINYISCGVYPERERKRFFASLRMTSEGLKMTLPPTCHSRMFLA